MQLKMAASERLIIRFIIAQGNEKIPENGGDFEKYKHMLRSITTTFDTDIEQ